MEISLGCHCTMLLISKSENKVLALSPVSMTRRRQRLVDARGVFRVLFRGVPN